MYTPSVRESITALVIFVVVSIGAFIGFIRLILWMINQLS